MDIGQRLIDLQIQFAEELEKLRSDLRDRVREAKEALVETDEEQA